jgi:hypothetical protein
MAKGYFPIATGVPAKPGPPDWWSSTPAQPQLFDGSPDDPRWVGSFSHSFGEGAGYSGPYPGVQVLFRGLTDPGNTQLLLSWLVQVDPKIDTTGGTLLYVGFGSADATRAVLVEIQLALAKAFFGKASDSPPPFSSPPNVQISTDSGRNWNFVSAPTWTTDKTRVWINTSISPGSDKTIPWAVQMVVPLNAVLEPTTNLTLNAGPSSPFKMWYNVQIWTPVINPQPNPLIPYIWPGTQDIGSTYPTVDTWADATISNDPNAPNPNVGISIGVFDIGTEDPPVDGTTNPPTPRGDSSVIRFDKTLQSAATSGTAGTPSYKTYSNIFYARPTFPSTTPPMPDSEKELVRARFRLANWGSQIGDITPETWKDIPGGEAVPWKSATQEISFPWPKQTDLTGPHPDPNTIAILTNFLSATNDQCLLVQLSSSFAGETFLNDSIRRNMDVVPASKFSRNAEISIVGLTPFSRVPRDVYLYLETVNMPTTVIVESPPQSPPLEEPRLLSTREGRQDVPTYRLHVYHDTGKRNTLGGVSRPILKPQSSFGYFATHDGNLIGWAARLHGAIRIAENFYLLRVPNNGVATVNTVIQAIEDPNEPVDPEDPIVPMPPPLTAVTGAERFFIGFFAHGGVASVANFQDRFVSPIDSYAYKQSEVRYEYYLHSTRLPEAGFVQGQRNPPDDADAGSGPGNVFLMLWNVDDSTGRVSLQTSYSVQREEEERKETLTNDGCVKVYAVGQWASGQQRPRVYYIEGPNMDPDVVRQIQQALSAHGVHPGPIDGDYGPKTAAAVAAFQAAHGLVANGEVGPQTAQALGIQL